METEKIYFSAKDIAEMLDVSMATSYKLIRGMNEELQALGYIVLQGKVPRQFFKEKYYGLNMNQ